MSSIKKLKHQSGIDFLCDDVAPKNIGDVKHLNIPMALTLTRKYDELKHLANEFGIDFIFSRNREGQDALTTALVNKDTQAVNYLIDLAIEYKC